MHLYRPGYILSGIIFLIAAYASYEYFKFSTTVTVIIVFISISNLYYAFSDPKEDLPESKFPPGYLFFKASKQFFISNDNLKNRRLLNKRGALYLANDNQLNSKNILQLANIYGMLHVSARQLMLDIRRSDYSLMRNLQMPARIETET